MVVFTKTELREEVVTRSACNKFAGDVKRKRQFQAFEYKAGILFIHTHRNIRYLDMAHGWNGAMSRNSFV
jgi:hypothetical protein